jgi:hypothetical protein
MLARFKQFAAASVLGATFLFMAGCRGGEDASTASASRASPSRAVACDKCRTVWVQAVNDKGVRIPFAYHSTGTDTCPDCTRSAAKYFASGKLDDCKMCGTELRVVEAERL